VARSLPVDFTRFKISKEVTNDQSELAKHFSNVDALNKLAILDSECNRVFVIGPLDIFAIHVTDCIVLATFLFSHSLGRLLYRSD
jgi:hypothetical protein